MDDRSIAAVVAELSPLLTGRAPGKIFQFTATTLAIDFGLRREGYLFVSVEPSLPRLYLIKRRVRELERQSRPLNQFGLALRKELANTTVTAITKQALDRVVLLTFRGADELGHRKRRVLVAQLTGRSANLILLDENERIVQMARPTQRQHFGEQYVASPVESGRKQKASALFDEIARFASPSEAADAYYTSLLAQRELVAASNAARAELKRKIAQQQKLLHQLEADLASHAAADEHKRIGDLLLANVSTAKREADRVTILDYFAKDSPPLELTVDESKSLPEEAQRRFAMYQRSKRAITQITSRIDAVKERLRQLSVEEQRLEQSATAQELEHRLSRAPESSKQTWPPGADAELLGSISRVHAKGSSGRTESAGRIPGARHYLSSDGFDILVGRTSTDNDRLTFKVAKPNDLWLHAADYGGSHVVVRNASRKPLPQRTLLEAAQLAGYFSQARKDPKVDVHYTERKFVSKPKGAKAGLVRLQRFRNITVEPKEAGTKQ